MSHAKDCADVSRNFIQSKVDFALDYIVKKAKEISETGAFSVTYLFKDELGISPDSYIIIYKLCEVLTSNKYGYQVSLLDDDEAQIATANSPDKIKVSWEHL